MSTVEIITPAYNAAGTISRTIESVIGQTFTDFRLKVVDDGSADGTTEVVRRYLRDPRIELIREEWNRGAASARNRGLEGLSADYVAFLDADDFWEPEFLARMVALLDRNPGAGMAWCDMAICGGGPADTYRGARAPISGEAGVTLDAIYTGVTFLPSSCLFQSSFFRDGLRWSQECAPMEDMPIFLAIGSRSRIVYLPEVLSNYRIHAGSSTSARGAIGRNYPAMLYTFRRLYKEYAGEIPRRSYRRRMWYIYHHAADSLVREGERGWPLLLRAIFHRPSAVVSWKVLAQAALRGIAPAPRGRIDPVA
jgi:glycosyltransferase involved in cell wall biosynthesis